MGDLKCKTCKFLNTGDSISLVSRMVGYTAECGKTGALFNIEKIETEPQWCPLREENKIEEKMK